jgi:ABC-type spermidine/putrescine transport system permease subunit I
MYPDNLTIASLLVFASAFGSFVFTAVIRGCSTALNRPGCNRPSGD